MTTTDLLLALGSTLLPLGAFWALFRLALQRERCYRYNRALLLLAPLVAVGLPLLPLPQWLLPAAPVPTTGLVTVLLPALSAGPAPAAAPLAWQAWLLALYGLGVLLGLGRLGWQLAQLRRVARPLPREARPGYTLACTGGVLPTSSFGRTVYWDETAPLPPAEAHAVLTHEIAHVRQGHSYDVLWLEAWRALLWFNPFAHLLLPSLRLTHELLADEAAAPGEAAAPAYAALLARLAVRRLAGPGYFALLQPFIFSFTLTRIAMLQNRIPVRRWKQWLVLPVLGGLLFAACRKAEEQPVPQATALAASGLASLPDSVKIEVRKLIIKAELKKRMQERLADKNLSPQGRAYIEAQLRELDKTYSASSASETSPVVSPDNPQVYDFVEQMPQLPGGGGQLAIVQAIADNLIYPKGTDGKPLAGKVVATYTIGADGIVQDVKVVKSPGPAYSLSLANAINKLPRFEPGRQGGKAVAVKFTEAITFQP